MSKKNRKLLTFGLVFLGIALVYDVYYFMSKKKTGSVAPPAAERVETDSASKDRAASEPSGSPGRGGGDGEPLNASNSLVQLRARERSRRLSERVEDPWKGDPFLFAIEEKESMPLVDIRERERERALRAQTVTVVEVDPVPALLDRVGIQGTLVTGRKRLVLIDGVVLGVGDSVPGLGKVAIDSVRADTVVFRSGKKTYTKNISGLIGQGGSPEKKPSSEQDEEEKEAAEPPPTAPPEPAPQGNPK